MTRGSQNARVRNIHELLMEMAEKVEIQIMRSIETLKDYDEEKIESIINSDDEIDGIQKTIEEACIKFIGAEQPLAKDLRRVFAASKIVTDLERMADHAVDICKISRKLKRNITSYKGDLSELWIMDETVRGMITGSVQAYINNAVKESYRICAEDDEVDKLYKSLFEKTIEIIKTNDKMADFGAQLLFVIKYLERIADHVTNICEWTIFSKDGVYVDLNE